MKDLNPLTKAKREEENCLVKELESKLMKEESDAKEEIIRIQSAECKKKHVDDKINTEILINPLEHYDYEEIEILKKHKIKSLLEILQNAINTKYKISFYKGCQIFMENLTMLILMISISLKSN